jgi:signal transduction histidine kinase
VLTTNAQILASAALSPGRPGPVQRTFFRRLIQSSGFIVAENPVDDLSGKPVVNVGFPIFDRIGKHAGAVFATLDLSWFSRFGSDVASLLPKGATWTEIGADGKIRVRFPAGRDWIGKPFPEKNLLKTVRTEREGVADVEDNSGNDTYAAFAPKHSQVLNEDTVTVLSIPKDDLFASADRTLFRSLGWLVLAAGLPLLLVWIGSDLLIIRPVKSLVRSSARLASGDMSVRTGLSPGRDELGRLTLAFDAMAQSLEQRELERKRATHKLQILSHRLVEVQESERRHIARELHDEIGQSLTVAEMNLQAALQSSKQTSLNHRLEASIEAVERVLDQVHDLSLNLRPSMLDDLGLEPALRWYTNRQAGLTGLKAKFEADQIEGRLEPVIETECFRVAQEALTNVTKHSKAKSVTVSLKQQGDDLHLRVRDDGVGFDVNSLRERAVGGASLGLLSMQERATLAGGNLEYNSAPGRGTEVHAWFPLKFRPQA